jgi:hypothetical protein
MCQRHAQFIVVAHRAARTMTNPPQGVRMVTRFRKLAMTLAALAALAFGGAAIAQAGGSTPSTPTPSGTPSTQPAEAPDGANDPADANDKPDSANEKPDSANEKPDAPETPGAPDTDGPGGHAD